MLRFTQRLIPAATARVASISAMHSSPAAFFSHTSSGHGTSVAVRKNNDSVVIPPTGTVSLRVDVAKEVNAGKQATLNLDALKYSAVHSYEEIEGLKFFDLALLQIHAEELVREAIRCSKLPPENSDRKKMAAVMQRVDRHGSVLCRNLSEESIQQFKCDLESIINCLKKLNDFMSQLKADGSVKPVPSEDIRAQIKWFHSDVHLDHSSLSILGDFSKLGDFARAVFPRAIFPYNGKTFYNSIFHQSHGFMTDGLASYIHANRSYARELSKLFRGGIDMTHQYGLNNFLSSTTKLRDFIATYPNVKLAPMHWPNVNAEASATISTHSPLRLE